MRPDQVANKLTLRTTDAQSSNFRRNNYSISVDFRFPLQNQSSLSPPFILSFPIPVPFPSHFFTARCYASAVLAMAVCPSVCLSVCPSQVGVLLKRLNLGSHKQQHTIVQGIQFSRAKDLREIRPVSPPRRGHHMQVGWVEIGDF